MKRILASIIAMSIVISSLAVSASAEGEEALRTTVVTEEVTTAPAETEETISETEATEEEIAEEVDDKDATTYTSGDFNYTVSNNEATIVGYIGTSASVSIPATISNYPVVSIENAFNGNTTITNVTIPSGVTTIGKNAFKGCTRLAKVTFPSTVTTIGHASFENCSVLTGITLPSNLTKIDHYAFKNCSKIGSVTFPAKLTSLGYQSFYASGIKAVSLPESLTYFGYGAFSNCPYLASVNFYATSYDGEYTILEWGDNNGNNGFADCNSLTTVKLNNEHITLIPRSLFYGCSKLTSVTLPTAVTTIDREAFYNCDALVSLKLPANVETIGYRAFYDCNRLATINFPAKLVSVDREAFRYSAIKSVYLPESLTFLGAYAFSNCEYLTNVNFYPTSYDDDYTVLQWGDLYGNNGAFNGCKSLVTAKISPYATTIPTDLFYDCTNLRSVTIPAKVTNVYSYAFHNCKSFDTIYYTGKASDWGDVIIETKGNDYFVKADLSYRSVYSPEISSISSKAGDVTITWNALGNVTSYRVYRSTSYAGTKTFLGAVTTNKYTDTSAEGGKTYYYHVQG